MTKTGKNEKRIHALLYFYNEITASSLHKHVKENSELQIYTPMQCQKYQTLFYANK